MKLLTFFYLNSLKFTKFYLLVIKYQYHRTCPSQMWISCVLIMGLQIERSSVRVHRSAEKMKFSYFIDDNGKIISNNDASSIPTFISIQNHQNLILYYT